MATHDDLEEILGRGSRQLSQPEIVDDQQRHDLELGDLLRARAVGDGSGDLFERRMGLAIGY